MIKGRSVLRSFAVPIVGWLPALRRMASNTNRGPGFPWAALAVPDGVRG